VSHSQEKLGELIEAVALDMSLWPKVLEALVSASGADGAALIYQSQADGRGQSIIAGIDPAATPLYFGEFATNNPLQRAGTLREKIDNFRPRILNDEHLLPKPELTGSDFYNGVLRPFDMHSILMVGLGVRDVHRVGINLVRAARRPQFDTPELSAMNRWHGALIRAFDVGMAVAPVAAVGADLAAVLDTLADAVFLVDHGGRIVLANRRAEEMVAAGHALRAIDGRLRPRQPDQARRLEVLIGQALCNPSPVGGAMALAAVDQRLPLSLTVTPLNPRRPTLFAPPATAMVRVCDFVAPLPVTERLLTELFQLTPAEARVAAALAQGLTPREVAERLAVSFNTVRAQLVRIFEKTGVSRQADLVRLMARMAD
jgi:DNA-binding CsgD family transcriptional regulator/PAS domain-containing protein